MASQLGLTCTRMPLESVTRIRSCDVSKMRRRSSVCWRSACSVFSASVMSRAILEAPMISPDGDLDRRDAERDLDRAAVLAPPHRLVVLDPLAAADPAQDILHLAGAVGRHDQVDVLADGLLGRISEQALGGRIPAGDGAVERLRHDRVVGGFDRRAVEPLARGEMVARGLGQRSAPAPRVRARRSWPSPRSITRAKARASTPVSPPASTRNVDGIAAADAFDRRRQLIDRPGQRSSQRARPARPRTAWRSARPAAWCS